MFGGRELKNLELRRRELVLQSTLNRLTMRAELQNLQTALRPADRIVSLIRTLRPWLLLRAPLAALRRTQPSLQRYCFLEGDGGSEVASGAPRGVETVQVALH